MEKAQFYGKAGEYLVCSDLLQQGFTCLLSGEGESYDILVETPKEGWKKIQVKTTLKPGKDYIYNFRIKKSELTNKSSIYVKGDFDYIALVALDIKTIAYFPFQDNVKGVRLLSPETEYPKSKNRYMNECPFKELIL